MKDSRQSLEKMLAMGPNARSVRVYGSGEIVHTSFLLTEPAAIFLSSEPRVGYCKRCDATCVRSTIGGYSGYCPYHDEDLTDAEMNAL